jgi:hypothetical protein
MLLTKNEVRHINSFFKPFTQGKKYFAFCILKKLGRIISLSESEMLISLVLAHRNYYLIRSATFRYSAKHKNVYKWI